MNKNYYEEEISIPDLFVSAQRYLSFLRRKKWTILSWMLAMFIIGVMYTVTKDDEYEASNTVLTYTGASGSSAQAMSRLAGLAGIQLPQMGGNQGRVANEMMIPQLLTTYPVAYKLGTMPLRFQLEDTVMTGIDYFSQPQAKTFGDHVRHWTLDLPFRFITWTIGLMKPEPPKITPPDQFSPPVLPDTDQATGATVTPNAQITAAPSAQQTSARDHLFVEGRITSALSQLTNRIFIDINGNVITIVATMPDPLAAADLAHYATEILMQEVVNFEIRKTQEELEFLLELYEDSERRYEQALQRLNRLRGVTSSPAQVELTRLQGESEIARQQFAQITLRVEEARIKLKEDTPTFAVLNPIQVPQRPTGGNPVLMVFLFTFFGMFLGIGWVSMRGVYDAMMESRNTAEDTHESIS